MKTHRYLLCLSALLAVSAQADTAAPAAGQQAQAPRLPGWQPAPGSVTEWADRCTDFTVNGWGFKDPYNTPKLISLFSDPAIYLEFAQRSLDPESYARIANTMLDPATAANYLEWSDPLIYARWTAALADPNFYVKAMQPFFDPATYLRWMMAPLDPRWWNVGMQTMNPAVWLKWATAPINPKVISPFLKAADPNTSLAWSLALANPVNYRFLSPSSAAYNTYPWFGALPPTGAGVPGTAPAQDAPRQP